VWRPLSRKNGRSSSLWRHLETLVKLNARRSSIGVRQAGELLQIEPECTSSDSYRISSVRDAPTVHSSYVLVRALTEEVR
jgi:hypothetical protein